MTEALAPLRELADQETERRLSSLSTSTTQTTTTTTSTPLPPTPSSTRRLSSTAQPTTTSFNSGTQTERYLKRYIEIFREHSFSTISMYRNIFPSSTTTSSPSSSADDPLALPSALQQFPFHLIEIFIEVLRAYLPNVTDVAARESLLMQVLYAANSLGRLGADFSMMIALLDDESAAGVGEVKVKAEKAVVAGGGEEGEGTEEGEDGDKEEEVKTKEKEKGREEPEWARIIKKHRVQAARLDALAAGRESAGGGGVARKSTEVAVR